MEKDESALQYNMLPRSQRLSVEQFNLVMENGRAYHSSLFLLRLTKVDGKSRVSTAVPNKVAKKATERNRLRRSMYNGVQPLMKKVKDGYFVVVFAKNTAVSASQEDINNGINEIFVKAGLLL